MHHGDETLEHAGPLERVIARPVHRRPGLLDEIAHDPDALGRQEQDEVGVGVGRRLRPELHDAAAEVEDGRQLDRMRRWCEPYAGPPAIGLP